MRSIFLLTVLLPALAAAQSVSSLQVGDRVRVTDILNPYEPRRTGVVSWMGRDSVMIRMGGEGGVMMRSHAFSHLEVSRGQRTHARNGAAIGAVSGLIVGFASGYANGSDCTGDELVCFDRQATGAMDSMLGAVVGAVGGLIVGHFVKTDKWVRLLPAR